MLQNNPPQIPIEQLEIVELIAQTHNGNVLVQRIIYNNHEYALKSILRHSIDTQKQLEHLFNERQVLWELSHPLINKLIATSKDEKNLHFVLELVEGMTLDKLLKIYHKLDDDLVFTIIYQVALALQYIHSNGYIYRDLKANNIFINQNGKITLIDFGFAKKINEDQNLTNSFCGTTHMMAPEFFDQNLESQGYSYSVDHYALGILFYELLVGHPPFGYEGAQLIDKILGGLSEHDLYLKIDKENSRNLIQGLLEKDFQKRLGYNNINEILCHDYFQNDEKKNLITKIIAGEQLEEDEKIEIGLFENIVDDIYSFGLKRELEEIKANLEISNEKKDLFSQLFE